MAMAPPVAPAVAASTAQLRNFLRFIFSIPL